MRRFNRITEGSIIDTVDGYLKVTGYNGSIVYADEIIIGLDGSENPAGERRLTLQEIAKIMKEVDGINRDLIYDAV